ICLHLREERGIQDRGKNLEYLLTTDIGRDAADIFRRLCRPGYLLGNAERNESPLSRARDPAVAIKSPRTKALVWRQWFTTLGQLATSMSKDALKEMTVRPLPGNACAISGEWCLGVSADSALPEGGLQIINSLVTPEAELDR